jgi:uncharacterized protein (DUF433 family)
MTSPPIGRDPEVMSGALRFSGTRVSAQRISGKAAGSQEG